MTTIAEIADEHAISKNHLTKVVHRLGQTGYIETIRGKFGGIRLSADPKTIRIGELVRRIEEDFALARCMRDCDDGSCHLGVECVAKQAFAEGLVSFFATLDNYTLADMIDAERAKRVPDEAVRA